MTWTIIDHTPEQITVEFDQDGETQRLNVNVARDIESAISPVLTPPVAPTQNEGLHVAGAAYAFEKGGILPPHSHDASTLHNIQVVQGTVIVHKDSGDVHAQTGDVVEIAVGETHSIEALEVARTVHWRVGVSTPEADPVGR